MFGAVVIALAIFLARYVLNNRISIGGLIGRLLLALGLGSLTWMLVHTLWNGGRLGTASITLVYVFVGIFFQYVLGLSLAMLTVQRLPGAAFLSGGIFAPDDDYSSRRRLYVSNAHGYQ